MLEAYLGGVVLLLSAMVFGCITGLYLNKVKWVGRDTMVITALVSVVVFHFAATIFQPVLDSTFTTQYTGRLFVTAFVTLGVYAIIVILLTGLWFSIFRGMHRFVNSW